VGEVLTKTQKEREREKRKNGPRNKEMEKGELGYRVTAGGVRLTSRIANFVPGQKTFQKVRTQKRTQVAIERRANQFRDYLFGATPAEKWCDQNAIASP